MIRFCPSLQKHRVQMVLDLGVRVLCILVETLRFLPKRGPFCWNISLCSEAVANNHSRTASYPCLHLDKNFALHLNEQLIRVLCQRL
ncbi:hypothetical protein EPI10_023945 [Gossypium australe]|uniref:Uncharacterized protein n=1 Tax=Gossypium australe TaxID=47621 RepID=A0A5B6VWI4_9ROSI|nr:hypothetical protein EPI10_023945 [Gossypium australe]